MKRFKWYIVGINGLLLLLFINFAVFEKEAIIRDGKLVLLELAPVDPRSLMQGDYMALNYKIATTENEALPKRGYCVVGLLPNGIAKKIRFQQNKKPLAPEEYLIEYTYQDWQINIGNGSFFFQEGQAARYEKAVYGGLKIDQDGNSILTGLYDSAFNKIQ